MCRGVLLPSAINQAPRKTRGGIREKMVSYGRKENYEKIVIKKENTTNPNVK